MKDNQLKKVNDYKAISKQNMKLNTISLKDSTHNIVDCRIFIMNEYKNPGNLIEECVENINFISNNSSYKRNNYYYYNNYNDSNKSSFMNYNENSQYSNEQLYEMVGKYHTRKDQKGNMIYYNYDNQYYSKNKNLIVDNYQNSKIGFPNLGNTCYMNAFLQILLHTPNFLNILGYYKMELYNNKYLIYNLILLSKHPYDYEYLINIKKIMGKVNPKYGTYEPGDSQNFAIDFIDKLISESKKEPLDDSINEDDKESNINKFSKYNNFIQRYNNKKDPFEKLFQFVEVTSYSNSDSFSININIELDFPQQFKGKITLEKLLYNKYSKNKKLADLPEILIISFNRGIIGKKVIKTDVSFNENLNLEPYIDKTLYNKNKILSYSLYGINERYGNSKEQGHYICYIKINYIWARFSDLFIINEKPSFISSDVFGLYYVRNDCIPK